MFVVDRAACSAALCALPSDEAGARTVRRSKTVVMGSTRWIVILIDISLRTGTA
jgi:hypothetical protein